MLTTTRGDVLTIGVVFAVYFASSGIESLRIGLNRAYGVQETRNWFLLRLESIGYVLIGAVALLALAFLIVLGPLAFATAVELRARAGAARMGFHRGALFGRELHPRDRAGDCAQVAAGVAASIRRHPARHRGDARAVARVWRSCSAAISPNSPTTYVSYYAGLASVMIALVFLYLDRLDLRVWRRAECRLCAAAPRALNNSDVVSAHLTNRRDKRGGCGDSAEPPG